MKERIEWNWWGTWVIDWLTCDPLSDNNWTDFGIWAKAYREANPEFSEVSDLELIELHYEEAMKPVLQSWIFFIWQFLSFPMYCIHWVMWQLKQKFF